MLPAQLGHWHTVFSCLAADSTTNGSLFALRRNRSAQRLTNTPSYLLVARAVNSVIVRVAITPGAALRKLERAPLLLRFLALPRALWLGSFVTEFTARATRNVLHRLLKKLMIRLVPGK